MPTLTTPYPPEVTAMINDLATDPDIIKLAMEPTIKTTQHSYGHYMNTLNTLATKMPLGLRSHRSEVLFWGDVLIAAGANKAGVMWAFKVYGY